MSQRPDRGRGIRLSATLVAAVALVASQAARSAGNEVALRTPAGPTDARGRAVPTEPAEPDPAAEMRGSEAWLSAGFRYDQNLTVDIDRVNLASAPVAMLDAYGYDQRRLAGLDVRTVAVGDLDFNLEASDRDYQTLSLQSGPVLHLDDRRDLYVAFAGSASFFGYEWYTGFGAVYLRLEDLSGALVRTAAIDVGFERTADAFGGGDAPWVDVSTTFGASDLLFEADWIEFTPLFEVYLADQDFFRYGQLEGTLGYGITPLDGVDLSLSVSGYRRIYDAAWTEGLPKRRDWLLRVDLGLFYSGVFLDALAIELAGAYEQNWSNDPVQSYDGGSAGFLLHWMF